jgi:hypothetical protein
MGIICHRKKALWQLILPYFLDVIKLAKPIPMEEDWVTTNFSRTELRVEMRTC